MAFMADASTFRTAAERPNQTTCTTFKYVLQQADKHQLMLEILQTKPVKTVCYSNNSTVVSYDLFESHNAIYSSYYH